jgi:hypothetical protein
VGTILAKAASTGNSYQEKALEVFDLSGRSSMSPNGKTLLAIAGVYHYTAAAS